MPTDYALSKLFFDLQDGAAAAAYRALRACARCIAGWQPLARGCAQVELRLEIFKVKREIQYVCIGDGILRGRCQVAINAECHCAKRSGAKARTTKQATPARCYARKSGGPYNTSGRSFCLDFAVSRAIVD